jgi:hypothetical protein
MTKQELDAIELDAIKQRSDLVLESTASLAAEFVQMKLAIGLSFARLSVLHTLNPNLEKALENRVLAQEALKTAIKFMNRANFTDREMQKVAEQIVELEKLLYFS